MLKTGIDLGRRYIFVDLHVLIGGILFFGIASLDGQITISESIFSLLAFCIYAYYLIQSSHDANVSINENRITKKAIPVKEIILIVVTAGGIYIGAEYTVNGVKDIATYF